MQSDMKQEPIAGALMAAAEMVHRTRQRIESLLEETRREYREQLTTLRDVERRIKDTDIRNQEGVLAGVAGQATETTVADPHTEMLRHKQAYLAEKLVGLAASARRLQTIIRQFELSAEYLLGSTEEADDPGNGTSTSHLQALELQEEERQRLAREIHDGPAQTLANAIFQMEFCLRLVEKDPSRLPGELVRLKEDLREGLADTRYFIFDLRPGALAELGLAMTIQRYVDKYQSRFNIVVSTDLEDDLPRLAAAKELAVFRVVQEALQNTRKHSGASQASVSLRRDGDTLVTSVADNGSGFEMSAVGDDGSRHFGILSMHERAHLIQGDLQVHSQPGNGTRMTLRIPIGSS